MWFAVDTGYHYTRIVLIYCCVFLLQLLMTVLSEMRNAAESKNNFVEVHLNGLSHFYTVYYIYIYIIPQS